MTPSAPSGPPLTGGPCPRRGPRAGALVLAALVGAVLALALALALVWSRPLPEVAPTPRCAELASPDVRAALGC